MVIVTNTMQLGTFPVDKTNFEEIRDALVGFGLTPNQSKVFFYLGKIGKSVLTVNDFLDKVINPGLPQLEDQKVSKYNGLEDLSKLMYTDLDYFKAHCICKFRYSLTINDCSQKYSVIYINGEKI